MHIFPLPNSPCRLPLALKLDFFASLTRGLVIWESGPEENPKDKCIQRVNSAIHSIRIRVMLCNCNDTRSRSTLIDINENEFSGSAVDASSSVNATWINIYIKHHLPFIVVLKTINLRNVQRLNHLRSEREDINSPTRGICNMVL